uniref:Uncharacterized protein n=1 Tax=Anguilla anguilla TaxID=7936 RepID=A0A0E9Q1A5_ANGAN
MSLRWFNSGSVRPATTILFP